VKTIGQLATYTCLAIAANWLTGCATPQVTVGPDIQDNARVQVSSIDVKLTDFAVSPNVVGPGQEPVLTRTDQAVIGGTAALGILGAISACSAPLIGPAICPMVAGAVGVTLGIGTGELAASIRSSEKLQTQAQERLNRTLPQLSGQQTLVEYIAEYGQSQTHKAFTPLRRDREEDNKKASAEATLALAVTELRGIPSRGGHFGVMATDYALSMQVRAILKRNLDGRLLADRTYRYLSVPRRDAEWSANGGEQLLKEIDLGYRQIAEWIVDDFFFMRPHDLVFPVPAGPRRTSCSIWCQEKRLDTLRPTLRWSTAFFKSGKEPIENEQPRNNLRFDIKVFQAKQIRSSQLTRLWPVTLVYSRQGLDKPEHTMETDLAPCTDYLWSVRGRYEEDGVGYITEWSGDYPRNISPLRLRQAYKEERDDSLIILGSLYLYAYPFATHCPEEAQDQREMAGY
jgi:hypothetical protein